MLRWFGWLVLAGSVVSGCGEPGGDGTAPDEGRSADAAGDGSVRFDARADRPDAGARDDGFAVDDGSPPDGEVEADAAVARDASSDPDAAPCAPEPEVCDGQDQDCDGRADEALGTQPCDEALGACAVAMARCVDGAWRCDQSSMPEDCDGTDDEDCDGAVDEGCDCIAGERRACSNNTGLCEVGAQRCFVVCTPEQCEGTWGPCEGGVTAVAESCDGRDEDCDGVVDEALAQPCGLDTGRCVAGVSACVSGEWAACEGAVDPRDERCDGVDDDCDGTVDEGALIADVVLDGQGLHARVFSLGGAVAVMRIRDSQFSDRDELVLSRFDWEGQPLGEPQVVGQLDPGDRFRVVSTGDGVLLVTDRKGFGLPDAPQPCPADSPHLVALDDQGQVVETLDCGAHLWSRDADDPLVSTYGAFNNTHGNLGVLVGRDRDSLVAVRGQKPNVRVGEVGGSARLWAHWLRPGRPRVAERFLEGARACATSDLPACGTPAVAPTPGGLAVAMRDTDVIRISLATLAGQRLGDAVEVPADGIPVAVDLGDTAWVLWGTDRLRRAQVDAQGITVAAPVNVAVGQLLAAVYDGRRVTVYGRRADGVWSATIDRDGAVVAPARLTFVEVNPQRLTGDGVRTWFGELGVAAQGDRRAWLITDDRQVRLQIDAVASCSALPECAAEPEACNGVDEDCDGRVDEAAVVAPAACQSAMPGACGSGDAQCARCAASEPADEVPCDLTDEDCDGTTHDLPAVTDAPVCLSRDALVCGDARYVRFCGGADPWTNPCQRVAQTLLAPHDQRLVLALSEIYSRNWALTAELDGQPHTRRLLSVRYYFDNFPEDFRAAAVAGDALWVAALTSEGTSSLSPRTLDLALIRVPIEPGGLGAPIETPLPIGEVPSGRNVGQWAAAPTLAVGPAHVALAWVRPDISSRPGSVWLGVWNHAGEPVAPPREVVIDANLGVRSPRLVAVPGGFLLLAAVRIASPPAQRGGALPDGYRIRAWPLSTEGVLGDPRLVAELRTEVVWDARAERYGAPAPLSFDAAAGAQGVLVAWGADFVDQPALGVRTAFADFGGGVAAVPVDHRPVSGDVAEVGPRIQATPDGFLVVHAPNIVAAYGPAGERRAPVAAVEAWGDGSAPLDLTVDGNSLWVTPRSVQTLGSTRARIDLCR